MNKKQSKIVIIFTFISAIVALTTTFLAIVVAYTNTGEINLMYVAVGGIILASLFYLSRLIKTYNQ